VKVKDPFRSESLAETLAFDHELSTATFGVRFITVQINPLKIRTFLLTECPCFIVRAGLVVAFGHRSKFFFRVQLASCPKQAEIQLAIQINFCLGEAAAFAKEH